MKTHLEALDKALTETFYRMSALRHAEVTKSEGPERYRANQAALLEAFKTLEKTCKTVLSRLEKVKEL